MNRVCLKQNLSSDVIKEGKIDGIGYSGAIIPYFNGYENFIVDIDSLVIAKEKTAILKDHNTSIVIGHAKAEKNNNQITVAGKLAPEIKEAADVIALAKNEYEWEMSIGVYDGYLEPDFTGEVNGFKVEKAAVLRKGLLREVSVVSLGADMNTSLNILQMPKGENKMEKELKKLKKIFKLAEEAEVQEVIEKAEEIAAEVEEVAAEVDARDALIEELKAKLADLQAQIDAINAEGEAQEREEEVEASMKASGINLSKEKIKEVAKTKESFDIFMSVFKDVKVDSRKIDAKMCGTTKFDGQKPQDGKLSSEDMREKANAMVKEGKAKNFLEAINKLSQEKK